VAPRKAMVPLYMAMRAPAIVANLLDIVADLLIGVTELLRRNRRGRGGSDGETGGGKTGGCGEGDQCLVHLAISFASVGMTVRS
jgi:hypothetical protein